jgi:hypothetical protein
MNDTQPSGPPRPMTAQEFRDATVWYFQAGDGLVIRCRHLDMMGLLLTGTVPVPIVAALKTSWSPSTILDVMLDPDPKRREQLIASAHAYICAAAVEPRVVPAPKAGAPVDPDALTVTELGDALCISLMEEGITRRLAVLPAPVDTFREPAADPVADAGGPDGAAVQPAAEPMAEPIH